MKNFFLLSNVDYDYEEKFFLEGPPDTTEEQFTALCTSLMEEAGKLALQRVGEHDYVNTTEVMQALVTLLQERGFNAFRPKANYISGFYIGQMEDYKRNTERYDPETPAEAEKPDTIYHQLKDVHKAICEHNQVEWERMEERRKVLRHPAE